MTLHLPTALALSLSLLAIPLLLACAGSTRGAAGRPAPPEPGRTGSFLPLVALPGASQTVSFSLAFRAGSTDDPEGKEGLTALTAALVAEGGTTRRSYAALVEALFPMAADIDWHVERDLTRLTGRVHVDHLDAFYELLREVVLTPALSEGDFDRLREKARAWVTLSLRTADDEELAKAVLHEALYEGHPYAHPPIGTESGLGAISLDDVRAHRRRVLCRDRLTVGLAGGYPPGFAEKVLADLSALPACESASAPLPTAPEAETNRVWLVEKPTTASTAISFGYPLTVGRDHPDYAALYLVASWLGQHRNSVSHLFKKIREERGLNYGDYAYIEWWPRGGSTTLPPVGAVRRQQFFHVWIRPVPNEARHFALRAAVRELHELVERGLAAEEFADIRRFITRYVAFYTMTEERRLGYAIDDRFLGLERPSLEALREAWGKLTLEEVNAAIRRHLRADRLTIAAVTKDAEAFAAALAADAPSPISYAAEKPPEILEEDREIERFPIRIPRDRIRITPFEELFR